MLKFSKLSLNAEGLIGSSNDTFLLLHSFKYLYFSQYNGLMFIVFCFKLWSGRIPVRLYVWSIQEDFDNLEDAPSFDSWDKISYINRPAEIDGEGLL